MTEQLDRLRGGVAVITGAASGIGEALALQAAELDMSVVLADISKQRIDELAGTIEANGGRALAVETDVSKPEALDALADAAYDAFGEVRLLVNNAGIETLGFSWEIPAATWDKALGININGVVHGVRAFAPRMIAAGKPAFIANTSSVGGLGIMPVQTAYIMSKHAVLAFSECLRLEMELKQAPIEVSVILPGPVATRIFIDAEGGADPISELHREQMKAMLTHSGISANEAAQLILPQIASGNFWVSTHPEMTAEMAEQRAQTLTDRPQPQLSAELAALLQAG
ncbi:SDR family NAD(P)-dependent oxidoreductase [Halieaceae bacterium IMCC14734]|uniref:SDR family NAD(P)-dependent oxidoreductase n=1 Tax=Candidatus Litorirhabdus singularis TaxID=2518993 RepID=A0ABT3THS9_9GAMM|nr:SDR family NAD(P)-dependent oxidoreductase [Candidatus Litorirhabdus singularis]MCX2981765.1 SDR family NAD(P)-dependent oxidoreductase [Candidatus Litorirhabdus singularis]